MSQTKNIYDEIAKVAYELFESSGGMHGRELENWFAAEKIVMEMQSGEIEQDASNVTSAKGKKSSSKTEPKTLKTSKKTSEGSSKTTKKKSPVKKKTR